ncbi:MAG TPA: hypothetical protein VFT06_03660 [Flavisolibacter sp.]|nr:hypothetical protein [Flavisolibacter sp.]
MNIFLIISVVVLTSCRQADNSTEKENSQDTLAMPMMEPSDSFNEKKDVVDDVHAKFLDSKLVDYLQKEHPNWTVPNEYEWYPELFKKYMSDSALVSTVSGDFDGNGNKDCALLIDQGNGKLAAVAFLYDGLRYRTQQLTEITAIETDKIVSRLILYKPGRYTISDPDLAPGDNRTIDFKHPAIGVGLFKELYEGGDDVFYWNNNQLKSCFIEENLNNKLK